MAGLLTAQLSPLPFPFLQNSLVEQFIGFWDGRAYVLRTWAGETKKWHAQGLGGLR